MGPQFRVLHAEDDEDYAIIVAKALEASGWTSPVQRVPGGDAAIAYLKGEGRYADRATYPLPCALLLDIKMPGTTGLDVLNWLKDHPECCVFPALMLTSSDENSDVRRAYALGAHGYFVKPQTFGDLKRLLHFAHEFATRCARPTPQKERSSQTSSPPVPDASCP